MRAVDTNILVRLVVRDDPKQTAAAEDFVSAGAWAPHLALAELTWVLDSVYERTPAEIATVVEMLLEHAHITLEHADAVQDALTEFRSRPSLGFSDCLMVGVARKAGHVPLGTFDRDLARLDGTQRV